MLACEEEIMHKINQKVEQFQFGPSLSHLLVPAIANAQAAAPVSEQAYVIRPAQLLAIGAGVVVYPFVTIGMAPRPSSGGGAARATLTICPSAGASRRPGRDGG